IDDILSTVELSAICAIAGEISVFGGELDKTTSPDSALKENDPDMAKVVAIKYHTVVIATGETDDITDNDRTELCQDGHAMLQNITASGCVLTSVIAAFISVAEGHHFEASIEAVSGYGLAAEKAMEKAEVPGTFIPAFLDQLYFLK